MHPRSRVQIVTVERTRAATSTPESPGIPARNGFTTYFVLSSVTGLVCHRRWRTNVASAPGWADTTSANLTPASGRQDHTTSPSAATSLVRTLGDCSQAETCPAIHRAQNAAASTASRAASVTIAIRPLCGRDAKSSRDDLGWMKTEIFLQSGLDTKLPDRQITRRTSCHRTA